MIYTVTFNPALDYVVRMDALALGQVNRTVSEDVQLGGKGINVSWVLRELGHENVALGFVAGFTGKAIEDGLAAKGVATDFIHLPAGLTRINVKLKAGEETEINGKGPDISAEALEELFHKLDALGEGDVLVLAGSIPASMPSDVYESILARLEGKNVLCAVDATRDLLVNVLKYKPFLIKPNNHELGEIFGRVLTTDEEIRECAEKLQQQGARNVLVSMAGDGAMLLDENGGCHRLAAYKGKVKNSVGAGDSMVAGFLAGYLDSGDYAHALRVGSAAGSATAFSDVLATRSEIEALLNQA
ncbi:MULTISPECIES: 1-phosphofructokinase [Allofournierella]|uniref:Tagatose-6-phosphate kinase n=1 Tax=Allofournierella massiliensis TaxID=1650663 RepID=A0ABT7UQB0_9FIRM|nr:MULTISPECIES: 1-phosphofructokinase [Fournierella]MDM8201071.1 1-phosphofructokinase [Fournierella massiliensis]OUN15172.1 1-phosphofructokinase [Gemmiger sp. An87]